MNEKGENQMTHQQAYKHGLHHGPSDETRRAACGHPGWAYDYALNVDRAPRNDTRKAACKDPRLAIKYSHHVDRV